ncbi:lysozyme [Saccharomonospora sp. NPDC006951]
MLTAGHAAAAGGNGDYDDYEGAAERNAGSQIARVEGAEGAPKDAADGGANVLGHDVSSWQGKVDWKASVSSGAKFVYVKATEGTGYRSDTFNDQYDGAYDAGLIRGAYHFARPDVSGGAEQARYFVDNGGGWSADGRTLPGALDMEYSPKGDACYGKSPSAMVSWIKDFSRSYAAATGRAPVIYTSTGWWKKCTGNSADFGSTNPLWLARYAPEIGPLPAGWRTQTIWQFSDSGKLPGDQNSFNGDHDQLARLAGE